jgi:hypothetical protein
LDYHDPAVLTAMEVVVELPKTSMSVSVNLSDQLPRGNCRSKNFSICRRCHRRGG